MDAGPSPAYNSGMTGDASPYTNTLEGCRVLLTGAAGGIGAATARFLTAAGCHVAGVSRSRERLDELAATLADPGLLEPIVMDLAEAGASAACVEEAGAKLGGLDVLINNAGVAVEASIAETDEALWQKHMHLNATVPFLLARAALPHLQQSDRATVVNIGSVVSYKGYRGQGAYAASKHALYGLTKVLAREVHEQGIRVHFIAPGGVATDMIADLRPDIPREALAEPGEIADIILFLLTRRGNAVIDEVAIRRAVSEPWK